MTRRPSSKATPAQKKARERNWRIYKLRGLWWILSSHLSGKRLDTARKLVDEELAELGAEPASDRIEREYEDQRRYEKFRSTLIGDAEVW